LRPTFRRECAPSSSAALGILGDETGQGQNLSLRSNPVDRNPDRFAGIQRFTLYRYR